MFNFIMQFTDTNAKPNLTMVQVQADTLANAIIKAQDMLGDDTKGNPYAFVKCQGVSEVIVPEEEEETPNA